MPILSDAQGTRNVSQEELNIYLAALPKVWSKEAHLAEINALHEAEFDRRLKAADYVGRWELNAVLADPTNEYYNEAKELIAYWWNGWDTIKAYSQTVNENNFIEPLEFVNSL